MSLHGALEEAFEQFDRGEARYWVNDTGPELNGTVNYRGGGMPDIKAEHYIGLVDEDKGGMIAYGEPAIMEELAGKLNKLEALERIAKA